MSEDRETVCEALVRYDVAFAIEQAIAHEQSLWKTYDRLTSKGSEASFDERREAFQAWQAAQSLIGTTMPF